MAISFFATCVNADFQRDFLKVRDAASSRDARHFERAAAKIPVDHVLYPYVAYWRSARNLENDAVVADFLADHADSWLAERLRGEWLKDLGRRENWPAFLAEFPRLGKPDTSHLCLARRAELSVNDQSGLRHAIAMWFTGRDMPSVCTPLFSWLFQQGYLKEEDTWKRLRLAFSAGNTGVARSLATLIASERRPKADWIDMAFRKPEAWFSSGDMDWEKRPQKELGFLALSRMAKVDSVKAARLLEPAIPLLDQADRQHVWGLLALEAAQKHEPQAVPWFELTDGVGLTDFQREWWARAALREGNWSSVQRAIQGMNEETRNLPTWRYWHGRALKANGWVVSANQLFAPLSREHHYYGLLAEEELGTVIAGQTINIKVSDNEVEAASRIPGIMRALALRDAGLVTEAVNEWNWTTRNMTDRQLLAAAELAMRHEWYDRAIITAEKTRDLHDFQLRFITPYRELASRQAKENNLDEAWVYGLIRQESRFINIARSRVGASGLMQIMPATGKWIARRLGMDGFRVSSLNEPETNIKFGSYYLRHVQDSLDGHPVLATAAYNAGPKRAQRWRDSKPMEGAVYVESIPFRETRDYVKKVMSNAMYYARRFGQTSVLLRDRLGIIPARHSTAPADDVNDGQPVMESAEVES
ncbi:MAG: lytic transglycosylase domain-containing protein [Hydrogenophilaceae bacterium]|nr:lytic transglycosylase domain-containing protein [Hydrogenophilaceae bacterium]